MDRLASGGESRRTVGSDNLLLLCWRVGGAPNRGDYCRHGAESFFVEAIALGPGKTELFPESEGQFFATSTNLSIGFSKDPAGSVVERVVQMDGQSIKARKIK